MDPLMVITNSDAGTADQESLDLALEVLRGETSVDVVATGDPSELDSALHRRASRRIVVAGGDGSMHAVVAALHKRHDLAGSVLGLLPLGTGNDFARANAIPTDIESAARIVLQGKERPMDLLVDEVGEVVVNSVHVGAGANASRRGARWKERLHRVGLGKVNLGKLGYPIGAVQSFLDPPVRRLLVEVDGEVMVDVDHPVLMVAVGNGPDVGGGTSLTPYADPGDGRVDVMVSRAVGPVAKIGYVAALVARRHPERDDVSYARGTTVSVSGEEFWVSADGEVYGPERHRTWRLEPAAYSLIVPR
jgi:diacylglycerol kinase (ATP)